MPSEFFPESIAQQYDNFDFDFAEDALAGKSILLAGGSGGLGAASAALLVREGAHVAIGYRSAGERAILLEKALLAKYAAPEARVDTIRADITTADGRAELLSGAAELGPLYGLVVFAGDPARGASEDTLRDSIQINFLAPVLLARQAAERMQEQNQPGAIVLFSSMQATHVFENSTAYGAAKAALVHGAKVLAKEVGGEANIRVNVIAPGATMAGMAQASLRKGKYDVFVQNGVVPRFGRAEDVACTVRFLLEPDNYITGQVITVDGGMTLRRDLK